MAAEKQLRIDSFYAFVMEDEEGEGLCAWQTTQGWIPMVAADQERIKSLYPMAKSIAAAKGKPVKLIQYTTRTVLEEIDGS